MLSPQQIDWLKLFFHSALAAAAGQSPCPGISVQEWAGAAACEAANETGWGVHTPPQSNNVLGIKALGSYDGPWVYASGTEENKDGSMTSPQLDKWRVYPTMVNCFQDQIHILTTQKDKDGNLEYRKALTALTVEDYILAECFTWSTNTKKGPDVVATYHAHKDILQ